jgi:hypothetical protein
LPHSEASASPSVHRENIKRELTKLIKHLEADTRRVDDKSFRGLLEKSAEVLKGLRALFERYQPANEGARSNPATPAGAKGAGVKSAPTERSNGTGKQASSRKSGTNGSDAGKKSRPPAKEEASKARQTSAKAEVRSVSPSAGETASPALAVAAPKPQDPLLIAAREQQQRTEARAPKMPGGHSAPRPAPPRSGKPIWSKPHSS